MRRKSKKSLVHKYSLSTNTANELISDTTFEERLSVFRFCAAANKYLAGLLTASGALSTFLFLQLLWGAQLFSTPQMMFLFIIVMGFVGAVNIVCGLLLLALR